MMYTREQVEAMLKEMSFSAVLHTVSGIWEGLDGHSFQGTDSDAVAQEIIAKHS
jgi:hypothetical protein